MKKLDIKKIIDFLFPDESMKIAGIIIILVVVILSIVFTFIIVNHNKKLYIQENKEPVKNTESYNLQLLNPKIEISEDFELIFSEIKEIKVNINKYIDLFEYHEFGDFTNFYLDLNIYKKHVEKYFGK